MDRRVRHLTLLYLLSCSIVIGAAIGPARIGVFLRRGVAAHGLSPRDVVLAGPATAARSEGAARTEAVGPAAQNRRGQHYQLPIGTVLTARLRTTVTSATNRVDDQVDATLTDAVTRDGVELIPAGSRLHGRVSEVMPASRKTPRGQISLVFAVVQHDESSSRAAIRTRALAFEAQPPVDAAAPKAKVQPIDATVPAGHPLHLILAEPLLVLIPETSGGR